MNEPFEFTQSVAKEVFFNRFTYLLHSMNAHVESNATRMIPNPKIGREKLTEGMSISHEKALQFGFDEYTLLHKGVPLSTNSVPFPTWLHGIDPKYYVRGYKVANTNPLQLHEPIYKASINEVFSNEWRLGYEYGQISHDEWWQENPNEEIKHRLMSREVEIIPESILRFRKGEDGSRELVSKGHERYNLLELPDVIARKKQDIYDFYKGVQEKSGMKFYHNPVSYTTSDGGLTRLTLGDRSFSFNMPSTENGFKKWNQINDLYPNQPIPSITQDMVEAIHRNTGVVLPAFDVINENDINKNGVLEIYNNLVWPYTKDGEKSQLPYKAVKSHVDKEPSMVAEQVFESSTNHLKGANTYIKQAHDIARIMTAIDTGYNVEISSILHYVKEIEDLNKIDSVESMKMLNLADELINVSDSPIGGVSKKVLKRNIKDMQKEALSNKHTGLSAHIVSNIENMSNPKAFIHSDLYRQQLDVGSLSKRMFSDDFYAENKLAQTEEALYHYNNGLGNDIQLRHVPLTNIEQEYQGYLLSGINLHRQGKDTTIAPLTTNELSGQFGIEKTEEELKSLIDPNNPGYKFRDFMHALNEKVDSKVLGMRADREQMYTVKSILQGSYDQKKTLMDIIENQYADTKVGKYVLDQKSKNVSDDRARSLLRRYLIDGGTPEQPGMNNPLELSSTVTKDSKRLLENIDQHLDASYDPESGRFTEYHRANEIKQTYMKMMGELYEQRKETNAASLAYIDNHEETKFGVFDNDEANNMYNESIRYARIQEENDRSYKRHQAAIQSFEEEDKARPKQPMNQFRNAFAMHFLETGSEESLAKAQEAENFITKALAEGEKRFNEAEKNYPAALESVNTKQIEYDEALKNQDAVKEGQALREAQAELDEINSVIKNRGYDDSLWSKESRPEHDESFWSKDLEPRTEKIETAFLSNEDIFGGQTENRVPTKTAPRIAEDGMTQASYQRFRLLYGYDGKDKEGTIIRDGNLKDDLTYTAYTLRERNTANEAKWMEAQANDERIRFEKSQAAYRIKDIQDGRVTLQQEHVLAKDVNVRMNIQGTDLHDILKDIDERRIRSSVDQDIIHEMTDKVVQNNFINLVYDQKVVSESLRDKQAFLFKKLKETEEHILKLGYVDPSTYGPREVNVSVRDIEKPYDYFRKNTSELGPSGIKKKMSMSSFLYNMVYSHAPWMTKDPAEFLSTSELAFRTVLNDLGKNETTINLTDEHLLNEWDKSAEAISETGTPEQIEEAVTKSEEARANYVESLSKKGLKERLDDHLFMKVLPAVLKENFNLSGAKEQEDGFKKLIEEAMDGAEGTLGVHASQIKADDILAELKSAKYIYEKFPYYQNAIQLAPKEIEEYMREKAARMGSDVSFDAMLEHNMKIGDGNAATDFGEELMRATAEALDQDMTGLDKRLGVFGGLEGVSEQFLGHLVNYTERLEQLEGNPEGTVLAKYGEGKGTLSDALKASTDLKPEQLTKKNLDQRKTQLIDDLSKGTTLGSAEDYGLLLDMAKEMDQDTLQAVIGGQEATIFRGKNGDVLAHLQRDNKVVPILNHEKEAEIRQPHVNDYAPQKMYGEAAIKQDIGDGGVPTQKQFLPYDTIQGSGKYTIPTNPEVSIDAMQRFLKGKGTMTYLDIETTGLAGSTLDPKYVQPIEVFMQKVQWQPADEKKGIKAGLMKNADGEFVIKHGGKETVREMQLFNPLNEDVKGLMKDLIQNEDFTFEVGNNKYHVLEYDNDTRREAIEKDIARQGNKGEIHNTIKQKSDKMWFLRNIAKYAFPENEIDPELKGEALQEAINTRDEEIRRYQQYAGNTEIDSNQSAKFVTQLKEDAKTASDNLDHVSAKGANRVLFSNAQVGTNMEGVIKHVARFVGKGPVVGQNVANADWKKFMDYTSNHVAEAQGLLDQEIHQVLPELNDRFSSTMDQVLGDMFKHIEELSDTDGVTDKGKRKALKRFYSKSTNILEKMRTNDNLFFENSTEFFDQLEAHSKYFKPFQKFVQGYRETKHGTVKKLIGGDTEAAYLNGRLSELDTLRSGIKKGILPDQFREPANLNSTLQVLGVNTEKIESAQAEVARREALQAKLPSPKIIEQQYLFDMTNTNAKGRSAEVQFAEMYEERGLTIDDSKGLHTARTDVKNALNLVEIYGQKLSTDEGFMKYESKPMQTGDVIDLHRSVNKTTPLGVYNVQGVNATGQVENGLAPYSVSLADEQGNTHAIVGASGADLAQKMRNHTTFVGSANDPEAREKVVQRFAEDQGRRQMARASNNADVFDKYELEMKQLAENGELTHPELNAMNNHYNQVKQVASSPEFNGEKILDRVAANSAPLFEGTRILDLTNKQASPTKQKGFEVTGDWMKTDEAKSRRGFLNEVRAMEKSNVIEKKTSNSLIANMNKAIKEEGLKRGAKYSVFNKANLGTLDARFGKKLEGTTLSAEKTPDQLSRAIHGLAEDSKWMMGKDLDPEVAKEKALNQLVLPFLQEQKLIDPYDKTKTPRVPSLVRQMMKKDLAPLEEFDHQKSAELFDKDTEYRDFVTNKQNELLQPIRDTMTNVQKLRVADYDQQVEDLRSQNMYHPELTIKPSANIDVLDSFNFGRHGGIGTYDTTELSRMAKLLDTGIVKDENARNTLFGELFNRATNGTQIDLDEVISRGPSDQLNALEGLNWVTNKNGMYEPNTDIASHYMGVPGRYAGHRLGSTEVAFDKLNKIADQKNGRYTRGDGYTTVKNKINGWRDKEGNYPGKNLDSHEYETSREQLKESIAETKAKGNAAVEAKQNAPSVSEDSPAETVSRYVEKNVDPNRNFEHSNVISESIDRATNAVKGWATEIGSGTTGKALKWVAGLGVAAFALQQFHEAGAPMKLERRPMGHGVEGATGQANDGLQQGSPKHNPSTGGKTYVSSGDGAGGVKGKKIQVHGDAGRDVDYQSLNEQVNKNIGNFNVNMNDNRETMDRGWLEKQFTNYIDKGYAGE